MRKSLGLLATAILFTFALVAQPALAGGERPLSWDTSEPGPFLEFAPGEPVYSATASLAELSLPILRVTNPDAERSITVQLRSSDPVDGVGSRRSAAVELEAGGTFTTVLPEGFRHLRVTSKDSFSFEIEDADTGRRHFQSASQLETSAKGDRVFTKDGIPGCTEKCDGNWTLTCQNCSYGPYTHNGLVLYCAGTYRVYWNLNQPIGNWHTEGSGIEAWWDDTDNDGCPEEVTNELGHTYTITGTISY